MSTSRKERARNVMKRLKAARRKPLGRKAAASLAAAVIGALPSSYGAVKGGFHEYDNECREWRGTHWVSHKHCYYLDAKKPVVVTGDGYVYTWKVGQQGKKGKPDTRLWVK